MVKRDQIIFTHQEIATLIIKQQGIHEGHWSIYIEFGFDAADVNRNGQSLLPTALASVVHVGITRCEAIHPLAVDAAVANPLDGQALAAEFPGNGKIRLQ